jgi:glucose/arabinose dehydrogenase
MVGLGFNTGFALLAAAFLAGSLRRWHFAGAGILGLAALAVLAMLLASSIESLPSVFEANPIEMAKRIWLQSDQPAIIKGFLIGVPLQLIGFSGLLWWFRRSMKLPGLVASGFPFLTMAILLIFTIGIAPTGTVPRSDIPNEIVVPPGFQVRAYLPQGVNEPTSIAFDPEGRLFVATTDGVVNVIEDTDGDGIGDRLRSFTNKDGPALGLAISEDGRTVYVSGGGQVLKLEDSDGDGRADSSTVIVEGLPSFQYDAHSNNGIEIGPDGRLYMGLGSLTDHGPDDDKFAGSILVFDTDGSNLEVYALGLRNPYDIAFTPDGLLLATDNGPDLRSERLNWSPPDELNLIEEGKKYGYPDVYGYPPVWSDTTGPIAVFPSHSVPTGIVAYEGDQFPGEYQGRIFVTLFGPLVNPRFADQVEAKVVTVDIEKAGQGLVRGAIKDFAKGFVAPIDVAVDKSGRLYVADFGGSQVYQISWVGDGS